LSRSLPALLLLAACATPYEPFEGRPVLAAIKFEGNENVSSGDLLSHIATAPTTGFFSKTVRYYDADLFAIDVKRIERLYNQRGFYEAKVKDLQEQRDDKGRVTLVVKIEEGRRAYVRKMDFEGVEDLPRDEVSDMDDALPSIRATGSTKRSTTRPRTCCCSSCASTGSRRRRWAGASRSRRRKAPPTWSSRSSTVRVTSSGA